MSVEYTHGGEKHNSKCRLAPQDYHRFHSPCEGSVRGVHHIPGDYYSVKPVAVKSSIDVYGCNKRAILELETPQFGDVLFIMVAAVQVGSIKLTAGSGDAVRKVCPFTMALHSRQLQQTPCAAEQLMSEATAERLPSRQGI